jgi:hypothetical protein
LQSFDAPSALGDVAAQTNPSLLKDPFGYMAANKGLTGTAALTGMMMGQQKPEEPKRRKIEGLPIWAMQLRTCYQGLQIIRAHRNWIEI